MVVKASCARERNSTTATTDRLRPRATTAAISASARFPVCARECRACDACREEEPLLAAETVDAETAKRRLEVGARPSSLLAGVASLATVAFFTGLLLRKQPEGMGMMHWSAHGSQLPFTSDLSPQTLQTQQLTQQPMPSRVSKLLVARDEARALGQAQTRARSGAMPCPRIRNPIHRPMQSHNQWFSPIICLCHVVSDNVLVHSMISHILFPQLQLHRRTPPSASVW